MEINVKDVEQNKHHVEYKSSVEEVLNKRAEVIEIWKKAKIPGFRKGKAPNDVVNRVYKKQINDSVQRALQEDALHNTLFEKEIRIHGSPLFNNVELVGNSFTCDFEVFSKPDFTLPDLTTLEVVKPHSTTDVTEKVEAMLQDLRSKKGDFEPFTEETTAIIGDNVMIDYTGSVEGLKIESLSAQGELLTLGSSAVKEFDDNIVGMKIGDQKTFDIVINNSALPSIAGKTVSFSVSLTMGSRNIPHALDDSLAKQFNLETLDELRENVSKTAMVAVKKAEEEKLHEAIYSKLADAVTFQVPPYMSVSEAKYLAHKSKLNWDELCKEDKDKFLLTAENNVKISLILDKIREEEPDANLTDVETFNVIKSHIARYSQTATDAESKMKEMQKTGYLQILFSRIKDEQTMKFLTKTIKVIES